MFKQVQATRNANHKLRLESLEKRELMAADIQLVDGVLEVEGSNYNDDITVEQVSVTQTFTYFSRYSGYQQGTYTSNKIRATVRNADTGEILISKDYSPSAVDELFIRGGYGNDTIRNNTSITSEIEGNQGNDLLIGGSNTDFIRGDIGKDSIFGREGNDVLIGDEGNDTLVGGSGRDEIEGNDGEDLIFGGSDDDTISGGDGRDSLWGDYLIEDWTDFSAQFGEDLDDYGAHGDDEIDGGDENDAIRGQGGNDTLTGGFGSDYIRGGSGNDVIDGSVGRASDSDHMFGDAGTDTIYFQIGDEVDGLPGWMRPFAPEAKDRYAQVHTG